MKSNLKVGDIVKDSDGHIAFVDIIYERKNAPNQIFIKYNNGFPLPTAMVYECDLERIEK